MSLSPQPPLPAPALPIPVGWLGFLGIKSGGRVPINNVPSLASTFEMIKFYLAGQRVSLVSSVVANANNVFTLLGGPAPGKAWIIEGCSAASPALGVAAGVTAYIVVASAAGQIMCGNPSPKGLTGESVITQLKGPEVLVPGDSLFLYSTAAAAPTAFNWNVHIYGLEVSA